MATIHVTRRHVALLAVALLVVLAGCSGGSNQAADGGQPESQMRDAAGGTGGNGGVGSYYDAQGDRVVVRESRMELRVQNFTRAFRSTRTIADRYGGYVGDRSQNSRGDWDEGRVTVRVPAANFSNARDELAGLGHIEDESVSVQDFSQQYRDREQRINDLEREERELERLLNQTNDTDEADQVRDDLRDIRQQIRSLQSDQQSLEHRETLSTIHLSMHEPVGQQPPENYRTSFGFDDAFMEAFYGGLGAVKYLVVFFGYVIPIGLALLPLGAFGLGLLVGWRWIKVGVLRLSTIVPVPSGDLSIRDIGDVNFEDTTADDNGALEGTGDDRTDSDEARSDESGSDESGTGDAEDSS